MYANVLQLLNLSVTEHGLSCRAERFDVDPQDSFLISWDAARAPVGFKNVGNGVVYAELPERATHRNAQFRITELEQGWYEYIDKAHGAKYVPVLVLPDGLAVTDLQCISPLPLRFKKWKDRMAIIWALGDQDIKLKWKMGEASAQGIDTLCRRFNSELSKREDSAGRRLPDWFSSPDSDAQVYKPSLWETIVAFSFAGAIVLAILYAALFMQEIPARNFLLLRILLSFAAAVLGAVIPGFLHVGLSYGGLAIRAGGALALFVIVFFCTPTVVPSDVSGALQKKTGSELGQKDPEYNVVDPPERIAAPDGNSK